jgi:hypothetical protein
MSGPLILRGGDNHLSPSEFGGPQIGGIMVQGGRRRRSGSKRRGSKRSGSKRSGSKRRGSRRMRGSKRRGSRRIRGGNCGGNAMYGGNYNPLGMSRAGGMDMPMYGGMSMPSMSMSGGGLPGIPESGMTGSGGENNGMSGGGLPGIPESGMTGSGGENNGNEMAGGNIPMTPPGGGGRTRRLRKLSGNARRHRTKSYSAGAKKKTKGRRM